MAGAETVTVLRDPPKDTFGNTPAGASLSWEVPGWAFAPGPSTEPGGNTNQVRTDGTLYGLPVTEINTIVAGGVKPTDRIRVRGEDYQVIGRVQDWGSFGSVIVLRRVTG